MPGDTLLLDLPYPVPDDSVDVPRDIKNLADAIDPKIANTVPAGSMVMWPGPVAPAGWALMKPATTVPAAANPGLAAIFGQTGGQVTIPDMTDLFPVGAGATPLGQTSGSSSITITIDQMPNHAHPDNIGVAAGGSHGHTLDIAGSAVIDPAHVFAVAGGVLGVSCNLSGPGLYNVPQSTASGWIGMTGIHGHAGSTAVATPDHNHAKYGGVQANGGGQPISIRPPHRAVNYIIKLG